MTFSIQERLYKVALTVFDDRKVYNRYRLANGGEKMSEYAFANTSLFGIKDEYKLIMFLPKEASQGCIAHECFHAAGYALGVRGVKFSYKNDEPMAYLLEYFVNQIMRRRKCSPRKSDASKVQKRSSKRTSSRT